LEFYQNLTTLYFRQGLPNFLFSQILNITFNTLKNLTKVKFQNKVQQGSTRFNNSFGYNIFILALSDPNNIYLSDSQQYLLAFAITNDNLKPRNHNPLRNELLLYIFLFVDIIYFLMPYLIEQLLPFLFTTLSSYYCYK
jgi:hypothetical protein